METNCPGGPVERLVGRLRVAATKLGRSDEWEDLRDDLHHAAAEIERLRAADFCAICYRSTVDAEPAHSCRAMAFVNRLLDPEDLGLAPREEIRKAAAGLA